MFDHLTRDLRSQDFCTSGTGTSPNQSRQMMHLGIHHSNRDAQPVVHWACVVGPGGQRVVLHQLVPAMTDCESPGMFLLAFEPDRVSTTQEHSKDAEDSCLPSCGAGCDRRTRWCPRHRCLALPVPFDRLLRAFFGKIVAGSDGRRNVDYRRCTEIVSKSPQIFLSQRQCTRTRRNVFW